LPLTKVSAGVIAANAVVDSFGTQSITGDKLGLTAINANNIVNASITGAKLAANTVSGDVIGQNAISSNNIVSVSGSVITANTVANSTFQTGSIENYVASTGRPLTNRNIIINGAMQIAQRNTSVTGITTSGYYTADRWQLILGSAGTWTMNVESSGPANTEFRSSANVICTTADSSLSATDQFSFDQKIEGLNAQAIKKGTTAAESLTLSFWVKSSNTGTYICEFFDNDNTRQISKSYTINAANTWEKKTITVPPDTTGQLDNDNAHSIGLTFWLAAGTTFSSGTLNSSAWASNTNANRAVGQLNLANATGNYWAVTGVQLETGTVATPFEIRNIGQELALCQRYFQMYKNGTANGPTISAFTQAINASDSYGAWAYIQPMRSAPTLAYGGNIRVVDQSAGFAITTLSFLANETSNYIASLRAQTASGMTTYRIYNINNSFDANAFISISAEL
jgi:hypothetical protein